MSNNVALDSWRLDSPLSNLSTPSQADDSASTTNDRIFFGPIQSPEKMYVMASSGARFRTPVRRSTRLSAAMVPLPLFPESVAEDASTREGTPEEDGLPDEPSIILASRVLSACSNPSPPPSPPPTMHHSLPESEGYPLVDVTEPYDGQDANLSTPKGTFSTLEGLSEPIASSSSFVPPPPITAPTPSDDQADVSQPDLINFDSFSEGDRAHNNVATTPSRVIESTPSRLAPSSVDDLLSMSPHPPSTSLAHAEQVFMQQAVVDNNKEATATPDGEMAVVNSLVHEISPRLPSAPLIEMAAPEQDTPDVPAPINEPSANDEEQTPPLRRSTRPRRSRSSLPQTVTNTPSNPTPPEKQMGTYAAVESDTTLHSQQRKRKAKPSPAQEDNGDGGEAIGEVLTPKGLSSLARAHRELGSLSPMSAAVLTQLLPRNGDSASGSSTPLPPLPTEDSVPSAVTIPTPAPVTPPQQTTSFVFPKVGLSDASGDVPRPKSPLRPFSPSKFAEASRTPARRVPIAQAIADGTYSSQKLPGASRTANAPGSPVFKKLALNDPGRSPARRVPLSEALPVPPPSPSRTDKGKGKAVFRPQSPVRASSVPARERSASAEPQLAFGRKQRGTSAEPSTRLPALGRRPLFQKPASSDGTPSSALKSRTALPFPLTRQQRLPPAIPEVEESDPSAVHPAAPPTSPAKPGSNLRQPSAGSGSKIPRIGVKPYARPRAGKVDDAPSKLPTPAKARIVTKAKPLRIVNVGSSSGSSSDEGPGSSAAPKRAAAPVSTSRRALTAQSSTSISSETVLGHGVKRKREPETSGATPGGQQVLVMRKVVPGMFNKGKEGVPAPSSRNFSSVGQTTPISPLKPTGPIKARSALDWKKPQAESKPPPTALVLSRVEESSMKRMPVEPVPSPVVIEPHSEHARETREPTPPPSTHPPEIVPVHPPITVQAPSSASVPPEGLPDRTFTPLSAPTPTPPTEQTSTSQTQRRSTRSKRSQAPTTDVFGSVVSTSFTRSSQTRRRGPLPSETAGPFAGMTALALKTLTSANTIRNQQQVVTIQTEVIRKEGPRPDSPTTRVRSALEKQKEERVQQRKERAERRARRSAGSDLDIPPPESATDVGMAMDGESDGVDASFTSVDCDADEAAPTRHRRGPGDEEDYETPQRPERPAKRGRFEGGENDTAKEKDPPEKRVKWDKGLHTTIILHNTPPKPKWNTKAVPLKQTCLTPAAKSLRLDTLGNVLNAEAPLGGLVRENVVVKKFVFDDDALEVETSEPPPAAPPVKSTRSKKKAKS
ncbi:hypothetical protein L226DRAFT_608984 [Lentinus tigrinus ALCF2SS1-7]|uniref:Uncharacterized protein n=1 Tax=Lentinus tigrinus ALCF2SS1-6 TaxID=1328759 RepID=A0A5C2SQJ1_9APHY|nr:hypothetical protein L227DRAFT_131673 [Lentinus tigrinus ALCF2SS1-6]RPD80007.1 hypothetical protein L226DRAFT_608984 [Lentinus tigrinus ALCF2SS1-7]